MEKKKLIASQELRSYLKEQGIDQKKLLSLNRMTKEGNQKITDIITHFTNARPCKGGIEVTIDEERTIQTGALREVFQSTNIIDVESITENINEILEYKNFVIERINGVSNHFDLLRDDEKEEHDRIMEEAKVQVEYINKIFKEKGVIEITDLSLEVVGPIVEARVKSREILASVIRRIAELKKQKGKSQDQDLEI